MRRKLGGETTLAQDNPLIRQPTHFQPRLGTADASDPNQSLFLSTTLSVPHSHPLHSFAYETPRLDSQNDTRTSATPPPCVMDRRLSRYNDSSRRYSEASGDADLPPEDMRPIYYSEEAAPPLSVSPSASIARTGAQHGVSGGDAVAALKIGVDGFGHMAPPTLSSTSPSHRLSTTAVSEGSRTLPPLPSLPSSSHFLGEPRTLPALGSNLQPAPPNHPLPHPLRPHRPASASVSFPTSTDGLLPGWDQNRPRASSASVTITLSVSISLRFKNQVFYGCLWHFLLTIRPSRVNGYFRLPACLHALILVVSGEGWSLLAAQGHSTSPHAG